MIRTLIVDDEQPARAQMARLLSNHSDVEVVAQAANGFEALEQIAELHPDVVFLDIEMPGFNGFEVVREIVDPPLIVFATAYDEYAVKAFESNAVDYLLKPIQPARVSHCLDRLRTRLIRPQPMGESYERLLQAVAPERLQPRRRVAVRKGKRIVVLSIEEIAYVGIEDKLTFVYTDKDRYLSDRTVSELEQALEPSGFFRISRAHVVNLDAVRELIPWFSGTWKAKLRSGAELDVSRERARQLKDLLNL